MTLEDLQPGATVRGILPDAAVSVVNVQWHGSNALTLIYRGPSGLVADEILYRHDEARLSIVEQGRPWGFDGDGALFRLVAEAQRIRLAHLFDPVLAVHTSLVDPLPHQITAVYEAMLPRQPLRSASVPPPGSAVAAAGGLTGAAAAAPSAPPLTRRFHGTVRLDPARVGRDAGRIAEEVVAHLAGQPGAEVTVTLEIEARLPNGANEQTVRTVTENSRTLRFAAHSFETD